jgi:Domain of unknown function (DUF1707)
MATQPSLRIGDTERDAVAAELREHYAHGRLTLEEFNERLDAVFAAKTQRDLSRLTSDLPHVRSGGGPLPSQRTRPGPLMVSRSPGSGALAANWPGSQWAAQNWTAQDWTGGTRSGRRSRHGIGAFATLLAGIATWLLVYDVILVGVRFPLPGRLGLLVAIFTVIRGLLRRIFRGTRGRRF